MEGKLLSYAILLLLVASCHIATSSIGLQCYNEKKTDEKSSNYNFLVSQLVTGIVVCLIAIYGLYLAYTDQPIPQIPMLPKKTA